MPYREANMFLNFSSVYGKPFHLNIYFFYICFRIMFIRMDTDVSIPARFFVFFSYKSF